MMQLRPYQHAAVEAVYRHLRERDDNPCVVIPTAGGKTPVLAAICRDAVQLWNGRVLVLAHVRELLEQAAERLALIAPDLPVGIYSAGLKRRDLGYAVTLAGIQSVYEKAVDLGHFDLVIVDEAHFVPPDGEGMYRSLVAGLKSTNPRVRIIGLTATPFRLKSGMICGPENILNAVCYKIGVRELMVQGYLCPLRTKGGRIKPNTDELHVRAGEYVPSEVEALMDSEGLVTSACREILQYTEDRNSVLIFTSGVQHGQHVAQVIQQQFRHECGFICGETLPFERDELLRRFRSGDLKYLCNVNVLTHGFDAPNIDCVAILRPTLSPGLFYQMCGRGFRLHPGKTDCLVLDFGGNTLRHGPVDALCIAEPQQGGNGEAPAKECPDCHALIAAGYAACPECGHLFPPPERQRHAATAGAESILSEDVSRIEYDVLSIFYQVHTKRDAPPDAPQTMRVDYRVGYTDYVSEWVCFEHTGFPRHKAELWWRAHSNEPIPETAAEAVGLADLGALAETLKITVERREGDRFPRIIASQLADRPPRLDPNAVAPRPRKSAPQPEPQDESDLAPLQANAPCPNCGKTDRGMRNAPPPHAAQEICAWCGRWLRWVPKKEAEAYWEQEVPF